MGHPVADFIIASRIRVSITFGRIFGGAPTTPRRHGRPPLGPPRVLRRPWARSQGPSWPRKGMAEATLIAATLAERTLHPKTSPSILCVWYHPGLLVFFWEGWLAWTAAAARVPCGALAPRQEKVQSRRAGEATGAPARQLNNPMPTRVHPFHSRHHLHPCPRGTKPTGGHDHRHDPHQAQARRLPGGAYCHLVPATVTPLLRETAASEV